MALEPAILEIGMGIDLHGRDYTEAARRAVWDAVHRGSLMFLGLLGPDTAREMVVDVTVAIPTRTRWTRIRFSPSCRTARGG